jgi:hypothetical protein
MTLQHIQRPGIFTRESFFKRLKKLYWEFQICTPQPPLAIVAMKGVGGESFTLTQLFILKTIACNI